MSTLGSRLGPIVAQFAYLARGRDAHEHATGDDFRARLTAFLEPWPREIEGRVTAGYAMLELVQLGIDRGA